MINFTLFTSDYYLIRFILHLSPVSEQVWSEHKIGQSLGQFESTQSAIFYTQLPTGQEMGLLIGQPSDFIYSQFNLHIPS